MSGKSLHTYSLFNSLNFMYENFDEPLLITLTPNDILSTLIENKINN